MHTMQYYMSCTSVSYTYIMYMSCSPLQHQGLSTWFITKIQHKRLVEMPLNSLYFNCSIKYASQTLQTQGKLLHIVQTSVKLLHKQPVAGLIYLCSGCRIHTSSRCSRPHLCVFTAVYTCRVYSRVFTKLKIVTRIVTGDIPWKGPAP